MSEYIIHTCAFTRLCNIRLEDRALASGRKPIPFAITERALVVFDNNFVKMEKDYFAAIDAGKDRFLMYVNGEEE